MLTGFNGKVVTYKELRLMKINLIILKKHLLQVNSGLYFSRTASRKSKGRMRLVASRLQM